MYYTQRSLFLRKKNKEADEEREIAGTSLGIVLSRLWKMV